uniref:Uncharacterized protein n=1 Tax=uncultured Armatimonadetes bacterium TaxID=157466 RepID=A0A6J4IHR3_9BACT|nr:hypothetical protein AVDCRST_MAG63-1909 [uncultured Armatimonadetes bacterium]
MRSASAVFAGTVLSVTALGNAKTVVFAVERTWKGAASSTMVVSTADSTGACGYSFHTGQRYLVYAWGEFTKKQACAHEPGRLRRRSRTWRFWAPAACRSRTGSGWQEPQPPCSLLFWPAGTPAGFVRLRGRRLFPEVLLEQGARVVEGMPQIARAQRAARRSRFGRARGASGRTRC